jgi:hypothetical protein
MFYRKWGGGGWSRKSNRDRTAAKGYKYWKRHARQQFIREMLMSPREMRKYWNDKHEPLYGPRCRYSTLLKTKLRKYKLCQT